VQLYGGCRARDGRLICSAQLWQRGPDSEVEVAWTLDCVRTARTAHLLCHSLLIETPGLAALEMPPSRIGDCWYLCVCDSGIPIQLANASSSSPAAAHAPEPLSCHTAAQDRGRQQREDTAYRCISASGHTRGTVGAASTRALSLIFRSAVVGEPLPPSGYRARLRPPLPITQFTARLAHISS